MINHEKSNKEAKGFERKCLECGSINCELVEDGYFDWEEKWQIVGHYTTCNDCKSNDK